MAGKPVRKKREWNEYDKVLQSLYGIDLANMKDSIPLFGSAIRLLLSTFHSRDDLIIERHGSIVRIKGKNEQSLPPTFLNLAYHFGKLDWSVNNITDLIRKSNGRIQEKDVDARFIKAARQVAAKEFQDEFVLPLRKELIKHGLYFYCLPAISLELDETSGAPIITDGDEVLCLLPMTPEWGRTYGLSENDIRALAPQVLWLIKNLCGLRVITSKEQLNEALDGWDAYVSLPVRQQIQGLIEEKRSDLA